MDCAAFKELCALYALGALDARERAAFEAHLAEPRHDGCAEALAQAVGSVAALERDAPSETPRPEVWAAIQERLAPSVARKRRARRQLQAAVGATLACAAALLFVLWRHFAPDGELALARKRLADRDQVAASALRDRDQCRERVKVVEERERLLAEAVALVEKPGTQHFPLDNKVMSAATANAILHTGVARAYVIADGLEPVPNKDYELWVARGGKVVAAGLIPVDAQGRAVAGVDYKKLLGEGGAPDALMVTLEPSGGGEVARGPTILSGKPRT